MQMQRFLAQVQSGRVWSDVSTAWEDAETHWHESVRLGYIVFERDAERRGLHGRLDMIGPAALTPAGQLALLDGSAAAGTCAHS